MGEGKNYFSVLFKLGYHFAPGKNKVKIFQMLSNSKIGQLSGECLLWWIQFSYFQIFINFNRSNWSQIFGSIIQLLEYPILPCSCSSVCHEKRHLPM